MERGNIIGLIVLTVHRRGAIRLEPDDIFVRDYPAHTFETVHQTHRTDVRICAGREIAATPWYRCFSALRHDTVVVAGRKFQESQG